MDWIALITTALSLFLGGGWFVNARAAKKKASAEADSAAVAALKEAMEELRDVNREINAIHDKDTAAIAEKNETIAGLREELVALKMMVCRHDACPFREPVKGLGAKWWDEHSTDAVLTDTESIGMIGKRYGWVVKRLPVREANKDKANDNGTED